MGQRLDLHNILIGIAPLDTNGVSHVYFQPPESLTLEYPCIIYKRDKIDKDYANNQMYAHKTRYQVTAIDRNPDGEWQNNLLSLPLCKHDRSFVFEGLNHDVFDLYY